MYAQDNNILPVWTILSPAYHHISINSHPFLVGIVSKKYDGPVYVPAEVYKLISPEAVAALKKYNTEAIYKFA